MFKVIGPTRATNQYCDLSFSCPEHWPARVDVLAAGAVLIGDDECGPAIGVTAISPGDLADDAPAHAHGSDNFRIVLRGELTMGRERYSDGRYRFQAGGVPYPGESNDATNGMWMLVLMADRRGMRRRLAQPLEPGSVEDLIEHELHLYMSKALEVAGDLVDPDDSCGPSAIATTLGRVSNGGKLNGTFDDETSWTRVSPTTRAAVTLMGERERGPVVVLSATDPLARAMPPCRFDTEVFRLVVAGDAAIGDRILSQGDMRVQQAGEWSDPVTAGPNGLRELIIIGDRRFATPDVDVEGDAESAWPHTLGAVVSVLSNQLRRRPSPTLNAG